MTEISALNQTQFVRCQALKIFLWPFEKSLSKSLGAVEWDFVFFLPGIVWSELSSSEGLLAAKANALNFQISCAFGNVFPSGISTISQKAEAKC